MLRGQRSKSNNETKDRLKKISNKKFTTCFIYALDQFEKEFGKLWGAGKPINLLNSDESRNRDKWEKIRTNILNNGNKQARAMCSELDLYSLDFIGYKMEFKKEGD
jgi:hypothetical protein